jgi:hypothetical protein
LVALAARDRLAQNFSAVSLIEQTRAAIDVSSQQVVLLGHAFDVYWGGNDFCTILLNARRGVPIYRGVIASMMGLVSTGA